MPVDLQLQQINEIKALKRQKLDSKILIIKRIEIMERYVENWQTQFENSLTGRITFQLIPHVKITY